MARLLQCLPRFPGPVRPLPLSSKTLAPLSDDVDAAPFFADLFALLAGAVSRRDYESPELTAAAASGARTARRAGMAPERMLSYLRARIAASPLADVGDWYRGVLSDRLVARAIEAYFDEPA